MSPTDQSLRTAKIAGRKERLGLESPLNGGVSYYLPSAAELAPLPDSKEYFRGRFEKIHPENICVSIHTLDHD